MSCPQLTLDLIRVSPEIGNWLKQFTPQQHAVEILSIVVDGVAGGVEGGILKVLEGAEFKDGTRTQPAAA